MPRRHGQQADAEIRRARTARWRYLIRNRHFREEMREVRRAYKARDEQFREKRDALITKWELSDIPKGILNVPSIPLHVPLKNHFYESVKDTPPIGLPVEVIATPQGQRESFTFIKVDLSHPVDLLLELVKEELRHHRVPLRSRRRSDAADFNLEVYDLVEGGEKFPAIARKTGRPVSTVKSAYLAAKRQIYSQGEAPTYREVALNFDLESHFRHCEVCRNAEVAEEMCASALAYFPQDHESQRELSNVDLGAIEAKRFRCGQSINPYDPDGLRDDNNSEELDFETDLDQESIPDPE